MECLANFLTNVLVGVQSGHQSVRVCFATKCNSVNAWCAAVKACLCLRTHWAAVAHTQACSLTRSRHCPRTSGKFPLHASDTHTDVPKLRAITGTLVRQEATLRPLKTLQTRTCIYASHPRNRSVAGSRPTDAHTPVGVLTRIRRDWSAEAEQQPHDWRVHAPARCGAPREVQVSERRLHLPHACEGSPSQCLASCAVCHALAS